MVHQRKGAPWGIWPVGQAVKTPASHAGNAGSIPARVTNMAGVYYAEVPPVPIPNTEVKLSSAEDTWREAAWKNRSLPAQKKQYRKILLFSISFLS